MHKPAKYLPLLCAGLLAGSVTPGAAQSALQTLQQEITRQQEQLKQQEQRLLELEKQLQDAIQREQKTEPQPTIPAPEQEPKEAASKVASQPEASPPQVLRESGDPYKLFADDDFPKSVPFFGSDWRFSYGGYLKLDLITDFDGTGDPYQFVTATIPVPGAANSPQPGGYTKVHVKESRFNFEVRNTSENAPFTKVFFEMDFFDESSYAPRLRHAYLQYGNLIVGQTWTTLTEMRSLPFLIDFAYGDALYGGRTPQIRWQQPLGEKFSWAVGLESWNDGAIENPSMLSGTGTILGSPARQPRNL